MFAIFAKQRLQNYTFCVATLEKPFTFCVAMLAKLFTFHAATLAKLFTFRAATLARETIIHTHLSRGNARETTLFA